ncbi:MAG: hypothetical protein ABH844_01745 [Candidatus Omnitrophota bacterium]
MIYWVPFLHFYQPSIQTRAVLKKICNESYRPLIDMFLKHPGAKVTVNICGSLTDLLNKHGGGDILDGFRKLARRGQLEFVDSSKYHAILPLIPEDEIKTQIKLNQKTNSHFFKQDYKTRGFFLPEMCYSKGAAKVLNQMRYDWVLVSGIAAQDEWPLDFVSNVRCGSSHMKVFFRDDIISNRISFQNVDSADFIKDLVYLSKGKKDIYVITAMDAETFGHHIKNWERLFLAEVYKAIDAFKDCRKPRRALPKVCKKIISELGEAPRIDVLTMSEVLTKFSLRKTKPPLPSSWSTSRDDMVEKNYYPLWKDPSNPIHKAQWKHLNACFELMDKASRLKLKNKESVRFALLAREILNEAVFSCQFWWANKKRGRWNTVLINEGVILQEKVLLNLHKAVNLSVAADQVKEQFCREIRACGKLAKRIRNMIAAE